MGSSASTTSAPSIPDLLALDTLADVRTWVDAPDNLAVTMAALRGERLLALGHCPTPTSLCEPAQAPLLHCACFCVILLFHSCPI
jgi:hypothetical protein